ncbi:hypothetical protein SAMN05421823_10328 [Catalinimonas alkaloidigena]|uniref:MazG nucleotide pyrophosphohydrolase domain-containing protein n=1 Tax=Catalinimonas alkaloidigena TaxID=1075417 RepID=A0A1G9D7K5_9BACT|nr:hypothetical protein [Catalinimonas alkaloidigena]SDK59831.1 hypothetical protein SAMN05421823_10328 [Catalinimonas alkaloidigena]
MPVQDYIGRLIQQLALVLARVMGLIKEGKTDEALAAIDAATDGALLRKMAEGEVDPDDRRTLEAISYLLDLQVEKALLWKAAGHAEAEAFSREVIRQHEAFTRHYRFPYSME